MEDCCVVCGRYVPEGQQVCFLCLQKNGLIVDDRALMDELLRKSALSDITDH